MVTKKKAPNISIKYNVDPSPRVEKKQQFSIKELQSEKMKEKTPEPKKEEKTTSRIFLWLSILIIVGLIVIIINLDKIVPQPAMEESTTVAMINGEPVSQADLDRLYAASVPEQFQATITKDVFLERSLIPQVVLLQEAEKEGISVSEPEVQQIIDDLQERSGLDEEAFKARIEQDGITLEDVKVIYETNLIINKLLNKTLLSELVVDVPEQVKASHILVETEEEALALLEEIDAGADFGELASENSIDPSAAQNGGDLGFFGRGAMVPPFEQAAFSLEVGEISEPVKSNFGYHIIKVEDKQEEGTMKYGEITNLELRQKAYDDNVAAVQTYIDALVSQAEVEKVGEYAESMETEEPVEDSMGESDDEMEAEMPDEMEESADEAVMVNVDVEETLGACLASQGAKLYLAEGCPFCVQQKDVLGADLDAIETIICHDGVSNTQEQECIDAGIEGYPTWIINGEQVKGLQVRESLSGLTGCPV